MKKLGCAVAVLAPKGSMTRVGGAFLSASTETQNRSDIANARQSPSLPRSITLRDRSAIRFRAHFSDAR